MDSVHINRVSLLSGFSAWQASGGKGKRKDELVKPEKIERGRIAVGDSLRTADVFPVVVFIRLLINCAKTHPFVDCLAIKIIQSESRQFFRDKICRRQRVLVFLVLMSYVTYRHRFSNLHILHFRRCFIPCLGSNLITASSCMNEKC